MTTKEVPGRARQQDDAPGHRGLDWITAQASTVGGGET